VLFVGLVIAPMVIGSLAAQSGTQPGILVSRQLAQARHLKAGDVVQLASQPSGGHAREFRVEGIYEPTPDPMHFAESHFESRLHLPDLLALTGDSADPGSTETIGAFNLGLRDRSSAERFARDLSNRFPALVARPVSAPNERTSTFVVIERFHLAIAIVTVLGSAMFLLALMVMLVGERREAVGVLRLIGLTRRRLLVQVLTEGLLIAGAGTLFGLIFAAAAQRWFNQFFQWRYDTALVFLRISPEVVIQSILVALPLGVVASVLASWSLLRRDVLGLMRR
jgi:putative ABC transport system permease protein